MYKHVMNFCPFKQAPQDVKCYYWYHVIITCAQSTDGNINGSSLYAKQQSGIFLGCLDYSQANASDVC